MRQVADALGVEQARKMDILEAIGEGVAGLRDLRRRSYVNGCKLEHLQDDSIDAEVYKALGVADAVTPLSNLARQIEEAKDGGA